MSLAISTFTLDNGLRVAMVADPTAHEVNVTMRYRVGAIDDPPDHPGMAHLVEHLMFLQTLGAETLFAHLQRITSGFNGYTTEDATIYVSHAATDKLDELLSIEATRVGFRCTSINESAFEREREVVARELSQNGWLHELRLAVASALFPEGHPYRRGLADSVESVRAITRDQACAFADAHYATGNAALAVSGDITAPRLEASLKKFMVRIPAREVTPQVQVPAAAAIVGKREVKIPVDDDGLLLAWPVPTDRRDRLYLATIAEAAAGIVESRVKGVAVTTVFGGERAAMLVMIVVPEAGESITDLADATKDALELVPAAMRNIKTRFLGDAAFDQIQQSAIYQLFAGLENTESRDIRVAAALLDGRNPDAALADDFKALRELQPVDAARVARETLSFDRATVVKLVGAGNKSGHKLELSPPIHDMGQRRQVADPAAARAPLPTAPAPSIDMRTRTLPNGLKVVLLPVTSVPTVDVRLVFGAGTGDEPADKRGLATLSAHALAWDPVYFNDLLLYYAAGGTGTVDVEPDETAFIARGLDMHLDLLLSGLRRWVRDGIYDNSFARTERALTRHDRHGAADGKMLDAWDSAIYGAGHPYVEAGEARHRSAQLHLDDATAFRTSHFTPNNATLVISGRFDAALADQWIDFLFADWQGQAVSRAAPHTSPQPISIANPHDTALLHLSIALPASGPLPEQLVAREILADIIDDVRHQLGATYGLHALLEERRLSSTYFVYGDIDAPRTAEAVKLIADRVAALHADPTAAASAFVAARERVIAQLSSPVGSAASLSSRVQHDVAVGRAPLSDLQTVGAVRALTIDGVTRTLGDLELARASVMMRGPQADMTAAFAALGRTPTVFKTDPVAGDDDAPPPKATEDESREPGVTTDDLRPAIGEQHAATGLAVSAQVGYSAANVNEADSLTVDCCTGLTLAADVGFRLEDGTTFGLRLGYGALTGSYMTGVSPMRLSMTLNPIDIAAFISATGYDRIWGEVYAGLHLDNITDVQNGASTTLESGIGIGLIGGVDMIKSGRHRFGLWVRGDGSMGSSTAYGALSFGAGYRL